MNRYTVTENGVIRYDVPTEIARRKLDILSGKTSLLKSGKKNHKLAKSQTPTFILNLAPFKSNSFGKNLCAGASAGCAAACLFTAGASAMLGVQFTRQVNTDLFLSDRKWFLTQLRVELERLNRIAELHDGGKIAVRLNGTTDLDWFLLMEKTIGINALADFNRLVFYDYTKIKSRALSYLNTPYNLTFSRSETNDADCLDVLNAGGKVAVVFAELPATWYGFPVIDGDKTDERFLDNFVGIIGLSAKGKAKNDKTGFVVR